MDRSHGSQWLFAVQAEIVRIRAGGGGIVAQRRDHARHVCRSGGLRNTASRDVGLDAKPLAFHGRRTGRARGTGREDCRPRRGGNRWSLLCGCAVALSPLVSHELFRRRGPRPPTVAVNREPARAAGHARPPGPRGGAEPLTSPRPASTLDLVPLTPLVKETGCRRTP